MTPEQLQRIDAILRAAPVVLSRTRIALSSGRPGK